MSFAGQNPPALVPYLSYFLLNSAYSAPLPARQRLCAYEIGKHARETVPRSLLPLPLGAKEAEEFEADDGKRNQEKESKGELASRKLEVRGKLHRITT